MQTATNDEKHENECKALRAENEELHKDALRWRYTQREGYFECGPFDTDGDYCGHSVGILKYTDAPGGRRRQLPLNQCVEGRGDSLEEAIDAALERGDNP